MKHLNFLVVRTYVSWFDSLVCFHMNRYALFSSYYSNTERLCLDVCLSGCTTSMDCLCQLWGRHTTFPIFGSSSLPVVLITKMLCITVPIEAYRLIAMFKCDIYVVFSERRRVEIINHKFTFFSE